MFTNLDEQTSKIYTGLELYLLTTNYCNASGKVGRKVLLIIPLCPATDDRNKYDDSKITTQVLIPASVVTKNRFCEKNCYSIIGGTNPPLSSVQTEHGKLDALTVNSIKIQTLPPSLRFAISSTFSIAAEFVLRVLTGLHCAH